MRATVPLTPAVTDPKLGVWLFIESSNASQTGVYRCKDAETPTGVPSCQKARW